ncbi:UDP-N-acetylglucosamine--LPS N-acetylglucosamine transferase [Bradyrhizobium sp. WBOS7]|uniref:UDP-N-acetylglucosamine--LPS N-acetylglucosamine transferase n=1 Tax=Bradyrhizobium betae TaxID=244734 RepID=A0AAE9NG99_9BRAD|nr:MULTISPECIES: UDP-N-acetylglucosamine transferase subunit ALG14 [Bradyrhizobium]MDD1572972.1 UDP-N-acetylglucosamine--LPS N-acetylglucosamine transferase [Bradyrhizobium sp. WBOS1]UUO38767.1 UDP-N-acetylglucosamine--LPS N-acetylglucosamine transferase [Bradyrhizobium sp. WBOS01]MDD1529421.1 UDP-N-acetylglucosamine--LPS N-acetylglucosamine transferase [Bradyrhizobium sp. WBOS2]MDD1579055.1 UDP-N-acetylglucosamine--LPS N-acetylglucosamine transferase [Bradyrhizobium sp. WBOS7]MDD1601862.1 UDP
MTRRVLAIASGGGHWVQLRRLQDAFQGIDVAFATVYPDYACEVVDHRFYSVPNVSRRNKWHAVKLIAKIAEVLSRERPDVIVTTGAFPGLVAIALGKMLFGSKTIWIDSIANCEKLSTSGKTAKYFADVYLTQWPNLANQGSPDFWGAVL